MIGIGTIVGADLVLHLHEIPPFDFILHFILLFLLKNFFSEIGNISFVLQI